MQAQESAIKVTMNDTILYFAYEHLGLVRAIVRTRGQVEVVSSEEVDEFSDVSILGPK